MRRFKMLEFLSKQFFPVNKNYKYLQRYYLEIWKCYSKDFQKFEKLKLDIDFLNNFLCIRNYLSFNCPMFLMKTLYQFVRDSFIPPSISVIKNSNIFQKDSVNPKTFCSSMVKWGCQNNFAPVYWLIDWFLRKVFKGKKQSQANINQQNKIKQTLNNSDNNFLRAETSNRVKVAFGAFSTLKTIS